MSSGESPAAHYGMLIGSFLLAVLVLNLIGATLLFAVGGRLSPLTMAASACAAGPLLWRQLGGAAGIGRTSAFAGLLAGVTLTVAAALFISGIFYDLSYDGQNYHQEAVIALADGWNPLYDDLTGAVHSLWIAHYPKGPWINAAGLYRLTGDIEYGKAVNLLLLAASFALCYAVLAGLKRIGPKRAAVLGALIAANPVVLNQAFSFYTDGQLYSALLIFLFLVYLAYVRASGVVLLMLAFSTVLVVNTKFTGLVYAVVLGAGLLVWLRGSGVSGRGAAVAKVVAASAVLGVVAVGFNPYITNTASHGHPFYPVAGNRAVDILTPNTPKAVLADNRVKALTLSLFSRSEGAPATKAAPLKLPFSISLSEVKTFRRPDTRIGGFGPLFGGMVIIALVIFVAAYRRSTKKTVAAAACGVLILASVLMNPAAWWARYVPQLWLLPFSALLLTYHVPGDRLLRALRAVLVWSAVANSTLVAGAYCYAQHRDTAALDRQLRALAAEAEPVVVEFSSFRSNRLRFEKHGISYREDRTAVCGQRIRLVSSGTTVCTGEKARQELSR